jgi:hypothetical protein
MKNKLVSVVSTHPDAATIYNNLHLKTKQNKQPIKNERAFDVIQTEHLTETLGDYKQNAFVQFLLSLFPDDTEIVWQAVKRYFLGTFQGNAVFWQIDQSRQIRTGKLMLYNEQTGKRIAKTFISRNDEEIEIKANWVHSKLRKQGKLKKDFNLRQCFFGEHLLSIEKEKSVAVVESEKTAVICSICFPEFVWLACGGKKNLKVESLKRFKQRHIILYPDADGFAEWREIARNIQMQGMNVKVSTLIKDYAADEQKEEGYDLADYLINEQKEINRYNLFAQGYNSAVDEILNDDRLMQEFETILEEQKAFLVIDAALSEAEAECKICDFNNVRQVVLSLAL